MDRLTRRRVGALLSVIAGTLALGSTALAAPLNGTFALLDGKPAATAQLNVQAQNGKHELDLVQTKDGATHPIVHYTVDMTQLMHIVIVRDDFATFIHEHPEFNAHTGHFTLDVALSPNHRYYVYADSEPAGIGQQVFRFTLEPGSAAPSAPAPSTTPSPTKAAAGPYTVALSATTVQANHPVTLHATVTRNGQPATDLHPYLGAAAHVVFVNTSSLDYVHVHPTLPGQSMDMSGTGAMDMSGMKPEAGPKMLLHVPPLPAGTYKVWVQFRGGSSLDVAPFTIDAR